MVKVPIFIGEYRHNLDAKGRIAIPSSFRKILGVHFYALVGLDRCVTIYTDEQFEALYRRLQEYPDTKKNVRVLMQQLLGSAAECEPDGQGRVMIPANLIRYAGLKKDCAVVGVGNHVEIWDGETWENTLRENQPNLSDIAENLPEIH